MYENLNLFHSVFVFSYFYKCIKRVTEKVILTFTDRNYVRLNLYAIFVLHTDCAKPACCVLAVVQSEHSSIVFLF
jgi:hypothetical protein